MNSNILLKNLFFAFLVLIISGCGGGGDGGGVDSGIDSGGDGDDVVPLNTIQYTYDGAGRLITETYGNGVIVSYNYDNNGNILSRTIQ